MPPAGKESGYLQGNVTIGPLCPVEPCHVTLKQRASAYGARHLEITGNGINRPVYEAGFSLDSYYGIALPPGGYDVSQKKNGIDHSASLPRHIVISPGEATNLDISIDTVIR